MISDRKTLLFFAYFFILLFSSCHKIENNKVLLNNINHDIMSVTYPGNNVYVDDANGIILIHGMNRLDEKSSLDENISFQFPDGYELWINQTRVDGNVVKISDILRIYKNNIPIEIPVYLKNNSGINDQKSYILTFSKLPVFELKLNNIQHHPIINENTLSINDISSNEKYISNVKLNVRGRGSLNNPKSSYALYVDEKLSLYFKNTFEIFSRSNEYSLYSGYFDPSLIREKFGHDLFNAQIPDDKNIHEKVNMKFVDVFIDGKYHGVYGLMNTVNNSDLKYKNDPDSEFSLLEMNAQNLYSVRKSNEEALNDALLCKKGDLFCKGKLHKSGAALAAFANRNVICNPDYIKYFDTHYSSAYLSTVLATQGVDNITNNIHLAIHPALSERAMWNKNEKFPDSMRIYHIPWDMDMSLGAIGWTKQGGYDIDYSKFKVKYNKKAIHTKLPYKVPLEDQASLMTCYTQNKDGRFKEEFKKYWLENKNKYFNTIKLKKHLSDLYENLEDNGAYSREYKRWYSRSGSKFSSYELSQIMMWIDNRIQFIEKDFLEIQTDELFSYRKEFSLSNKSNVNVLEFNPTKVQLAIETKQYSSGSSQNSGQENEFIDGSATIIDLLGRDKNNVAGVTGGFFEYWSNGKFVHYKDMNLNNNDMNNHFYEFNTKMIAECSKTSTYPKDGVVTLPIGILKINDKWYSSEDVFSDVVGWNDKGEYKIERVKVEWDILSFDNTSLLKDSYSTYLVDRYSPKINVFRTDSIYQSGSSEYLAKHINPKKMFNNVVIYFDTFSETTRTPDGGLEVIVENGIITNVTEKGNNTIPKNGFILSISKNYYEKKYSIDYDKLIVGEQLKYKSMFIDERKNEVHYFDDMSFIRGKVQALVINKKSVLNNLFGDARSPFLDSNKKVKNIDQYLDADFYGVKHPRTALCLRKNKNWKLILVDGRKRTSFGMKLNELSYYLLNDQECDDAINFDGGSSANMIAYDVKMNRSGSWWGYCEGIPRPVSDALVLKKKDLN